MTIKIVDDFPSIAQRLKELEDKKRQIQNPEISVSPKDVEVPTAPAPPLFLSAKQHMSGDACSYCSRGVLVRRNTFYICVQCGHNFYNP